jgi:ubiquinone/menaquinone biosynthesis C-methylase UbiE
MKCDYKALTLSEFEQAADKFDDDDTSVYNMCRKDSPQTLEELKQEPFHDVLDAGGGTGAVLSLLVQDFPCGHYTGIDLSPKMIAAAKKKQISNASFVVGDCENLPFPGSGFDAVLCSQSFHHYPHPEDFFVSVQRVLRPNGRLILRDMAPPE